MRSVPTLVSSLALLVFLSACGPSSEGSDPAPEAGSVGGGGMSAEEMALETSCWLRNATAEEAAERPSPLGETEIALGDHVGKVCYGRPFARGREVEGGLIPFGEPWRLGANEATAIHLPFSARVGGVELEPGSYSLYAVAGEFEWEFHLNSNAERWGIPINEAVRAGDVASFTGMPRTLTEPVEQFTIHWHSEDSASGHLAFEWGTTRVEFEVGLLDHAHE